MTTQPTTDPADDDGPRLVELPRDECLQLLGGQVIGRLAVADFNSAPMIVPVNYAMDGDAVVFRSDYGTKFRLAVLSERAVSFEIDGLDPGRRSGWSVVVQGSCQEIDAGSLGAPDPRPWPGGRKSHWVRIVVDSITGRRIRLSSSGPTDHGGSL